MRHILNGIKKIGKKQEGFSLVEAVCALALLVLVIMSFTILVTAGGKMNADSADIRRAYNAGVEVMVIDQDAKMNIETGVVIFNIGGTDIPVTVTKKSTKQTGDQEIAYLEKFVPVD